MRRKDINPEGMRKNWKECRHLLQENLPSKKGKPFTADDIVISEGDVIAEQYTTEEGYNISLASFDSVDEYMEQMNRMLGGMINHTSWARRKSFTWADGCFTDTKDTLEKGVAPSERILEIFEELREVVEAKIGLAVPIEKCRSARRRRVPSWGGGSINMARYNEMQTTGKVLPCFTGLSKRADRPVIKIGLNISMSWQNGQEDFARIASACAVLCDKMETLGYGVEVYAVDSARATNMRKYPNHANGMKKKDYKTFGEFWKVSKWLLKEGDNPMDVQRIMSHGMSGLLRCWGFSDEFLVHGGGDPSHTMCNDTPKEVVKEVGLDILIEKSWSRSNVEANADRIVGMVEELIGTP
jgi:hypothetical protein